MWEEEEKTLAKEIIPKISQDLSLILQDLSLKTRKKGIVIKIIYPDATNTPRNYMIVLLNDKSKLYHAGSLRPEFAVNLAGESSHAIGVSDSSAYIVKPTIQDYLELWGMYSMYTRYKKNGVDNKSDKG